MGTKSSLGMLPTRKQRAAAFRKRRVGLVKKLTELSILCGCKISLVVINDDSTKSFSNGDVESMFRVLERKRSGSISSAGAAERKRSESISSAGTAESAVSSFNSQATGDTFSLMRTVEPLPSPIIADNISFLSSNAPAQIASSGIEGNQFGMFFNGEQHSISETQVLNIGAEAQELSCENAPFMMGGSSDIFFESVFDIRVDGLSNP